MLTSIYSCCVSGINHWHAQVGSHSWDLSCPTLFSKQGYNESRPACSRFYQSNSVNLQEQTLQILSGLFVPLVNYPYTFFPPIYPVRSSYFNVCLLSFLYCAPLTALFGQPPCQPAVGAPQPTPLWAEQAQLPLLSIQNKCYTLKHPGDPPLNPLQFVSLFLELRKLDSSTLSLHMEALSLPFPLFWNNRQLFVLLGMGLRPILRGEAHLFVPFIIM